MEQLIEDVKNYLDITWDMDASETQKLTGIITRGKAALEGKIGTKVRSFRYRSEGGQMPRIKNHNFITFNDGILQICELSERKIVKTKMDRVRYGDMTVGIKRFWDAKVAGNDIEKTVAIPKIQDIADTG